MSTTINEIKDRLSSYNITSSISYNCNVIDFRYISTTISKFNPYCLYIFKSSNLPNEILSNNKINFLIIKDKSLPDYLNKNKDKLYNYIVIDSNILPIYELVYIIQDVLNINTSLIAFQEEVLNTLSKPNPIEEIIKISYKYLKNPILLLNSMYHTCTYYTGETTIDDTSWQYQLRNGIPHPTYSLLYNQNTKNRSLGARKDGIITTYFPEIMNYKEITTPIIHGNFTIARVSILECNKTLGASDYEILKTLGNLIYPLLLLDKRFSFDEDSNFDSIMKYLLTTNNPNEVLVKNTLSSLNINTSNNMYLLVFKDGDNINSRTKMKYIKQYISSLFSNHIVFVFENSIIVVFNNNHSYESFCNSKEYNVFIEAVNNYTLKVGISKLFNNFMNMKVAYHQCLKALEFGKILYPNENSIYYFEDFIIQNLVSNFLEKDNINNILDPKLKKLLLDNNNDLYITLMFYINNNQDMKKTASNLSIHYNTLKYRLQKISDLYNMDLNNMNYLVKLKFCFMALEINKQGG